MSRKKVFSLAVKMDKILHKKVRRFFKRELAEKLEERLEGEPEVLPRVFEYSFVIKNLPEKGRVLEVGCTASFNALPIILAELGYDVYGIDLRPFKVRCSNFEFIACDARYLPFRNVFECCYSISSIEHIGLPGEFGPKDDLEGDSKALKEMIDTIKPDGSLIITIPFGKSYIRENYERIYDVEDVKRLFKGLEIVEEEYIIERERHGVWFMTSRDEAAKADHMLGRRAVGMFKLHKQERNNKH